jgi:hypothetical protein
MIRRESVRIPEAGDPGLYLFLSVIFLIYTFVYLGHGALPGNSADPEGWWGWWDQSKYIQSSRAFAIGNLAGSEHWYPPGYALLAAPFHWYFKAHAFFFINALCTLIVSYCFIKICKIFSIGTLAAALIFLVSLFWKIIIFEQFVIPWSTTPTCALYYIVLLLFLNGKQSRIGWLIFGFSGGLIAISGVSSPAAFEG